MPGQTHQNRLDKLAEISDACQHAKNQLHH